MVPGVADVGQNPLEGVRVEVAAAHRDDRAEAAIEGAPARGLHDVHRAPKERVALQHPGAPVRQPYPTICEALNPPVGVVEEAVAVPVGETGNALKPVAAFEGPNQLAERQLSLAPHDKVHPAR